MRSMTGFGRGEASNADGTLAFRVEITSLNRTQFELKFILPRDMGSCEVLILQAVAAAMIETCCDEVNDALRRTAEQEGLYCRPRFSPGYGDFSIEHQRDFSRLLDTPRKIGLTVTESCLLAPIKSVTAVIGLSETPQPCHRKGCEECGKTDCAYRR